MTEVVPNSSGGRAVKAAAMPDGDLFSQKPEDDEIDQRRPVLDDGAAALDRLRMPFEVDPADLLEQQQLVPMDEDDYR